MSQLVKDGDRLVLEFAAPGDQEKSRGFDFQLLSPLLLGLLAPFMVATHFFPEALHYMKLPIWLFLIFMFFVCTGLFIYTVGYPGRINSIVIDRGARSVEISWRSKLSTTSQLVPFQEIAALRARKEYDADGYPTPGVELVLRSRAVILLPPDTTEQQLRPLRAAIGLG